MTEVKIIAVIGRRGSGKSTLVFRRVITRFPRWIMYDSINANLHLDASVVGNSADLLDAIDIGEPRIIVSADKKISFETTCQIVNKCGMGYTFIIDEFHLHYKNWSHFESTNPDFNELIMLSRHKNVGLVVISQRPQKIPPSLLSQASDIYCFHVIAESEAKCLKESMPDTSILHKLDRFHYYHVELGGEAKITLEKTEV
ncbi:MAG: ATP-binding protein [Desulfobacteraceae bacterium]|nr:ATP-binding protein [Desulfobacteraceae bacterium]